MATPDLQAPSPTPGKSHQGTIVVCCVAVLTVLAAVASYYLGTFDMHGTFTTAGYPQESDSCPSWSSTRDEAVFVYDTSGVSLGSGHVEDGTPAPGYKCIWSFTVRGLPASRSAYVIEMGKYGTIVLPRDQAENPVLFPKTG